ncbi:MAG TPA: serine hydroxymethyltransferase, partial [Firmicutes bacterium]|nr:serine hydroxymethyltransferase [Bacillota bacterium]
THKTLRGPRGGLILCREKYREAIDKAVFPGIQGGPLMHVIAAKAVALGLALKEDFRRYQQQVVSNARAMAEAMVQEGFRLVSGGTDNHLLLVDVSVRGLTGKKAETLLGEAGITVNKNTIPFDMRGAKVASGIRVGTPAVTTRGMKEDEMKTIGRLMGDVLLREVSPARVLEEVQALCRAFPLYPDLG